MTTPTTAQRRAYQRTLEARGLPPLYAFMASINLSTADHNGDLWCGFIWHKTPEGDDFWFQVCRELESRK